MNICMVSKCHITTMGAVRCAFFPFSFDWFFLYLPLVRICTGQAFLLSLEANNRNYKLGKQRLSQPNFMAIYTKRLTFQHCSKLFKLYHTLSAFFAVPYLRYFWATGITRSYVKRVKILYLLLKGSVILGRFFPNFFSHLRGLKSV